MAAPIRHNQTLSGNNPFNWDTNVVDFKGYNGSPNLKKSGVSVNFTQEMVDEWKKCANDPIYFAEKYIKIVHVDHGLIPIQLYEYQKEVIDKFKDNRKNIVLQSRQSGKALSLDTDIPIFSGGFKKMGDIQIGDVIIGNDGLPTTVTFLSEIHYKDTYKLLFSDGSEIIACEDHLWEVCDSKKNNEIVVKSTKDIFSTVKNKYFIKNTLPIEYDKKEWHIDPFTYGSSCVVDRIDDVYLYSSIDDRRELVDGLYYANIIKKENNKSFFYSDDIKQLIESLGIEVYKNDDIFYFYENGENLRYITDVIKIEKQYTKCLTVDNHNHIFLCGKQYIPTHNTTTATVIILHFILFNKHKRVALLANKGDAALEIMSRIQLAYEYLPKWLQSGIVEWNKGSVELENGCSVIASATSGSAIRGKTVALLYIDETAFVENWDEFYTSVYPTISSGKNTKMLFTSTSNGLNHFYKFWIDAKEGRNGFAYTEVPWSRVPGRDDAWKQDTIASMSFDYEKFAQEFENEFLGSSGTLISGSALKTLVHKTPIYEWDGFSQYVVPVKDRSYIMTCDVSRGKGLDYSAFSVIDITQMPYVQVAAYKSNVITPTDYAHVINKIGILYNTAGVLVENNDIGGQVADMLFNDLDYDNLLFTTSNGRSGKVLCGGGASADPSIRTTTPVKAKGCSVLKLLIEQQQLIINDFNTINELSRFSKKGKSYEAEDGNDDMVMSLVLFSWCTTQPYFSNLTDVVTLHNLRDSEAHLDDFIPFGFIVDGREDEEIEIDNEGNMWKKTEAWDMNY